MNHRTEGALGGSHGHWIAVVVEKRNGVISYFVLDSLRARYRKVVHELVNFIEKKDELDVLK